MNESTAYHNHRRAFVRQLAAVTKDLEARGGTAGLFQLLRATAVRAQLPPVFQFIIKLSCDGLPEWIYEKNADPHKLKLTSKLYHTFPRRTVLGILKLTQPASLFKNIANLFLATPLGADSLLQKLVYTSIDAESTKGHLKACAAKINVIYVEEKLQALVKQRRPPRVDLLHMTGILVALSADRTLGRQLAVELLCEPDIRPVFNPKAMEKFLTDDMTDNILLYYDLLIRLAEKQVCPTLTVGGSGHPGNPAVQAAQRTPAPGASDAID